MSKYQGLLDVVYRVNVKVVKDPQLWVQGFGGWHSKLDSELELVGLDSLRTYVADHLSRLVFKPAMDLANHQEAANAAQAKLESVIEDHDFDTLTDYLTYLSNVGLRELSVANLQIVIQPVSILSYEPDQDPTEGEESPNKIVVVLSHSSDYGTDFQITPDNLCDLFCKLQDYLGTAFAGNAMQGITEGALHFQLGEWRVAINPVLVDDAVVMSTDHFKPAVLDIEYHATEDGVAVRRNVVLENHMEDTVATVAAKLHVDELMLQAAITSGFYAMNPYGNVDLGETPIFYYNRETVGGNSRTLSIEYLAI